ncbi:hypothetical protein LK12_08310 [Novosphingobium malaysiense]|uniref:Uncharacterized protein n=2 Tax=Novosphingobium malaysiense TaxID=1348853 RepID=A0A0B1ZP40_9SPHN|nr:hypothetical protein LK12_08310 [Novosphingobium malaysiense]
MKGDHMPLFTITLDEDGFGEPKRIEFTADDAHQAFYILENERTGRKAILWQGQKRLGALQREDDGVWKVAG